MKAVAGALAAIVLLGFASLGAAAPPEDIAAYCRTIHPQVPFQVRCLNLENAAAARVGQVGPGLDPEGWNRCRSSAQSWSAMEQCLADSARATSTPPAGAGGAAAAPAGAGRGESATEPAPGAPAGAQAPIAPAPEATPPAPPAPAGNVPPSSTVILGPRPTPTPSSERERQTRAISEADADRQLRSVLERNPSANCRKKQYGPGWVITCE